MSFVLVLAALVGLSWPAFGADPGRDLPVITVSGEALVNVVPDRILITFGIETSDSIIGRAKKKNDVILDKAIAVIKARGVAPADIHTTYLHIEPRFHDYWEKRGFLGYFVQNAFIVTLNDPAKVEGLVSDVLQAGVTHIQGIDFQTTELKKHRETARDLALKAAKEKAELMAGTLGRRVGAPLRISEDHGGFWYNSGWWGQGPGQQTSQVVMDTPAPGTSEIFAGVALGKVSVRANVSVTFALE
jgi:hypothetical protein